MMNQSTQEHLPGSCSQGLLDGHSKLHSGPRFKSWKQVQQTLSSFFRDADASPHVSQEKETPMCVISDVRSSISPEWLSGFDSASVTSLNSELWFPWGAAHSVNIKWEGSRVAQLLRQLPSLSRERGHFYALLSFSPMSLASYVGKFVGKFKGFWS